MHRKIDIFNTTKIEYSELKSEADMFLYEIYYINKLKPPLNVDDKSHDELSVALPDIEWNTFNCKLSDKWKAQLSKDENNEMYNRGWGLCKRIE